MFKRLLTAALAVSLTSPTFADTGGKPGEFVGGPGPVRYESSQLSATAIQASDDLMSKALPVIREALGIKVSAAAAGASSFVGLFTQVLFFAAKVEMDPDASTGREVIQSIAERNEATGVNLGSAGHYASTMFTDEEMAELGLK